MRWKATKKSFARNWFLEDERNMRISFPMTKQMHTKTYYETLPKSTLQISPFIFMELWDYYKIKEFIYLGNILHRNVSNTTSIRINFNRIGHKFFPDLLHKKHIRLIAIMWIIMLIIYRRSTSLIKIILDCMVYLCLNNFTLASSFLGKATIIARKQASHARMLCQRMLMKLKITEKYNGGHDKILRMKNISL